ncbi:immunoglobulin domain-containing protein, partial [Seonamhaeicola marinus]
MKENYFLKFIKHSINTKLILLAVFLGVFCSQKIVAQCYGPPGDCDNDGIPDSLDLDDDNDGILDAIEFQGEDVNCPKGLFQVISQVTGSTIYRGQLKIYDTTSASYISIGVPAGFRYNAMGFHEGMFYALVQIDGTDPSPVTDSSGDPVANGDIITIHPKTGETNRITTASTGSVLTAGTVLNGGFYYGNQTNIHRYDIATGTSARVIFDTDNTSEFNVLDYVIVDDIMYGLKRHTSSGVPDLVDVVTIDLNAPSPKTANVTTITEPTGYTSGGFGAAFLQDDGAGNKRIFFGANNDGLIVELLDYTTGTPSFGAPFMSEVTRENDGAACSDAQLGPADTDNDGVPNFQDLDSDNDGCLDAIEGAGNYNHSDLTSTGNLTDTDEGTVDNDILNIGTIGVPNNGGDQSQNTTVAVTGSDVIASVVILPTPAEVCLGESITLTASPTGLRVTDFGATGATSDDTTIPIPTGDYIYRWYIGISTTPLTDSSPYSGTNTASLTISSATLALSGNNYRVEVTTNNNSCPEEDTVELTVNVLPLAPVANAQSFCWGENPTIADLIAAGTNLQWYTTASGGSPLLTSHNLVDATTYYVSQTDGNSCESPRTAVGVTVLADCDGDGVTDEDEITPPDGEPATDWNDPCDFTASDITLAVTAVTDCDGDGVTNLDAVDPDGDGTQGSGDTDWNDPCDFTASDITLAVTAVTDCDG